MTAALIAFAVMAVMLVGFWACRREHQRKVARMRLCQRRVTDTVWSDLSVACIIIAVMAAIVMVGVLAW